MWGLAPNVAAWESAVARESPQSLSLAGFSSSASMRNILLGEGNRVFSVVISKPNGGNLFYNHVTSSQTVPSLSSHQKKQAVTPSCCATLFLFSQCNKATSLTRAGEINLVRFWNRRFAATCDSKDKASLGVSARPRINKFLKLAPFLYWIKYSLEQLCFFLWCTLEATPFIFHLI